MKSLAKKAVYSATSVMLSFTMFAQSVYATTAAFFPTGPGAVTQWGVISLNGLTNWDAVNDSTCNNDLDYVFVRNLASTSTVTDIYQSDLSSIPNGSVITSARTYVCVSRLALSGSPLFHLKTYLVTNGISTLIGTETFQWTTGGWQSISGTLYTPNYTKNASTVLSLRMYAQGVDFNQDLAVSRVETKIQWQ